MAWVNVSVCVCVCVCVCVRRIWIRTQTISLTGWSSGEPHTHTHTHDSTHQAQGMQALAHGDAYASLGRTQRHAAGRGKERYTYRRAVTADTATYAMQNSKLWDQKH